MSSQNCTFYLCLLASATGCFRGPAFFKPSSDTAGPKKIELTTYAGGIVKGTYDPRSAITQILAVESGELAGVQLSLAPGSFSIPTDITMQPGADVATTTLSQELGVGSANNLQGTGLSVVLSSSENIDSARPFSLSIPVSSAGLMLSGKYLVILYVVKVAATGEQLAGIIPTNQLQVTSSSITFPARYFGAYQAATTEIPILEAVSISTTRKPTTKQEVAGLALVVDEMTPIAAGTKSEVTLVGKNFRSTMTVAMGDLVVSDLKVVSDVRATFLVPDSPWGPVNLNITQDGIKETGQFFALADKAGLPLITLESTGDVCDNIVYYDIKGVKQTGTKNCGSSTTADGGSVAVASTLPLGSSPSDHYKVTGTGTITAISSAAVGTRVTLYFDGKVELQHNSSLLIMPKNVSFYTAAGDVVEVLSVGSGIWKVVALAASHDSYFYGEVPSTTLSLTSGNTTFYSSYLNSLTNQTDDQTNFSDSTSAFTVRKTGFYLIGITMSASRTTTAYVTGANLYIDKTSGGVTSSLTSNYLSCSSGTSACSNSSSNAASSYFLKAGDTLKFRFSGYVYGSGLDDITFASSAGNTNSISIILVNELQ